MAKKINLTTTTIEALRLRETVSDPITPGLSIERLQSGKLTWQYNRRVPVRDTNRATNLLAGKIIRMAGGSYPATSIAAAREWAGNLNAHVEAGRDPREAQREAQREAEAQALKDAITFDEAWKLYFEAVEKNEHRKTRTVRARPLKASYVAEKRKMYARNIKPRIGHKLLRDVTRQDINEIIVEVTKHAPTQANRTGAELSVLWKWISGVRGRTALGIAVDHDPTTDLADLWNAERDRERWLDHDELPLFLRALAEMPVEQHRRGALLLLLTGCRKMEIMECPITDIRDGMLIITAERSKNGIEHPIVLGDWGRKLTGSHPNWLVPANWDDGPMRNNWSGIINRVRLRMEKLSGRTIEHLVPHDLRRTMRSHLEDHGIDETLAERMLNHKPQGLVATYNRNRRAAAMADGFARWDQALANMAREAGVGDALGVPQIVTTAAEIPTTPEPQNA